MLARLSGYPPRKHAIVTQSHKFVIVAGRLLVVALFGAHVWLYRGFLIDDVFISLRYVQQWIHGNGLVYNIGERVEGYSNFLWVVLLAPLGLLGLDLLLAAKLLAVVCGLLTLLVTWRLAQPWPLAWVPPLLLAASAPFAAWSVGGLETPLVALLLTASVYAVLEEERHDRGWYSGLLLALLALTRPDALLFAGIAVMFRLWWLVQARTWPRPRDYTRAAIFLALVGSHLGWRLWYYGDLLPNTVYAKSMGMHLRGLLEGAYYLYQSLASVGGIGLLVVAGVLVLGSSRQTFAERYIAAYIILYMGVITLAGGDWMPASRFLVHVLPLVWVLLQIGLVRLRDAMPEVAVAYANPLIALVVVAQVCYLLLFSLDLRFINNTNLFISDYHRAERRYLAEHVQPGDTVAVVMAGYAYHLPLDVRVVDMVGLNDRHIARVTPQFPGGLFGSGDVFGKWDVDYVLAQRPRYVQGFGARRTSRGWQTEFTGTTRLLNDPRFAEQYRWVEEPAGYGWFVRVPD